MKKYLFAFLVILSFLALPVSAFAITDVWTATSTDKGYIAPNTINGNNPYVSADHYVATSTSATSTFAYGLNVTGGCIALSNTCLTSNLGTLTSITATSPLTGGTITSSGPIGIQAASASQNGYLSLSDYSLLHTATTTFTSPLIYTLSTNAVTCQTASGSQAGCLSSTDWTTFNGKQASGNYITALTGDVTASGPGSVAATLATVNGNVGPFGGASSIPSFTVNGKGLITAASANTPSIPASDITSGTFGSGNYVFPAQLTVLASTTLQNFTALNSTTTNATTTSLAVIGTGSSTFAGPIIGTGSVNGGATFYNTTGTATTSISTGTSTFNGINLVTGCFTINGGTCLGGSTASSTLLGDNNTFTGKNVINTGTSTDWFSTVASSTNLFSASANFGALTLNQLTGTQCLHEISGVVSGTGSDCVSGGGGAAYPFTPGTFGSTNTSATTTAINDTAGLISTASSTISLLTSTNSTSTNATSTNSLAVGTGSFTFGVFPNGQVSVASSSPWALLSVSVPTYTATEPMFAIGSSTGTGTTTPFIVASSGNVGIGTSSPFAPLSVVGNSYISSNLTAAGTLILPALTGTQCLQEINGSVSGTGSTCGSGSAGVTSLAQTYGTGQTGTIVLGTTTDSFNGLNLNEIITNSGTNFTFSNNVTGTLNNAGLTNSSINIGNLNVALGGTIATSTFNLSIPLASTTGILTVAQGGTSVGTLTGCLTGNGTGAITGSGTCNTTNATVSSVGLSSPNSTLTLGGTNPVTTSGTINADLNLTTGNIWTAASTTFTGGVTIKNGTTTNATSTNFFTTTSSSTNLFTTNATITNLSVTGTATSTFGGGINLTTGCFAISSGCIGAPGTFATGTSLPVQYATVATLPAYTASGGVITEVGTGALSVDGNSPTVGQRILVKNESGACTSSAGTCQNGIYTVTAAGSGIAAFVITRALDYNSSANVYPGIATYVIGGATLSDDWWALTTAAPITVGTTGLTYVESSGGGASVASVSNSDGTLTISPTTGAVIGSLALSHGNVWTATTTFAGGLTATNATSTNATSTVFYAGVSTIATTETASNFNATSTTGTTATSTFQGVTVNGQLTAAISRGATLASSTLAYIGGYGAAGTTTVDLMNPLNTSTMIDYYCKTDIGTVYIDFGNGTATTTAQQCTSSGTNVTLSSNNVWSARQNVWVQVGDEATNPNVVNITTDIN